MPTQLGRLIRDEEGTGSVEYALLLALVAVVVIAGFATLGRRVLVMMSQTTATVSAAPSS